MKSEQSKLVIYKNRLCMLSLLIVLISCSNVTSKNEKSEDWPFMTYYYNVPDVGKVPDISSGPFTASKSAKNYVSPTIQTMQPVRKITQGIYDPPSSTSEIVMEKKLDDIENSNSSVLSPANVNILNTAQKSTMIRGSSQSTMENGKLPISAPSIKTLKKMKPLNPSSHYDSGSDGKLGEINRLTPNRRIKIQKENSKLQKLFQNNKRKLNKKELGNYIHTLKKMNSFTMKKVSSMSNHFEKLLLSLRDDIADSKKFKI